MGEDLESKTKDELIDEVRRLRAGICEHRDSSGHEPCWHRPKLWSLLPEMIDPKIEVPEWPQFMRGCIRYRQSLDKQSPNSPRICRELGETKHGGPLPLGSLRPLVLLRLKRMVPQSW